jgi:hypothetical protein
VSSFPGRGDSTAEAKTICRVAPVRLGSARCLRPQQRRATHEALRYSINVTLDGCCDHRVIPPDEELHRHHAANLERADALLFGRVTYEMMEAAWRQQATGTWPDWMADWMIPFARTIDGAKKYVVSGTLDRVTWNAELVQGDLGHARPTTPRQRRGRHRHALERRVRDPRRRRTSPTIDTFRNGNRRSR